MLWFNIIGFPLLAFAAAYITTYFSRRRHEARTLKKAGLRRGYVPDIWYYISILGFEALWRTFLLNLAFAGVSVATVTTGYVSRQIADIWLNPLSAAAAACVVAGFVSQIVTRDDVMDRMSAAGIMRVVLWVLLFVAAFAYSIGLSHLHSGDGNGSLQNCPAPAGDGLEDDDGGAKG